MQIAQQSQRDLQVSQADLQIVPPKKGKGWKIATQKDEKKKVAGKRIIIIGLIFAFLILGLLVLKILPQLAKQQSVDKLPNRQQKPLQAPTKKSNEQAFKKQIPIVKPPPQLPQKISDVNKQPLPAKKIQKQIVSNVPEGTQNNLSQVYVNEEYILNIPKKFWMYDSPKYSYMSELNHANNVHFAKKSEYEFILLNRANYKAYLSPKSGQNVEELIKVLEKRESEGSTTNLKHHLPNIIKKLILFNVLNENGGVVTDGEFAMTEDFSWIKDIIRNKYVNRGNRGIKPQIVGFYSVYYSFEKKIENIKPFPGMNGVDKYTIAFPTLEDFFVAAVQNTRFLPDLLAKITKLLLKPEDYKQERVNYLMRNINGDDIYYSYFFIACQAVLQSKQKKIDQTKIDQYRHFAFDYYGLNLINSNYGPYKFSNFWGDFISYKTFQSLTQYPLDELYANVGPMRYIAKLPAINEINNYFRDTKDGRRKHILEGSFAQRIYFPNMDVPFIKKNEQKKFVNATNQPWLSLPKIIWVFWDKGMSNAPVNNQICVQNLRRMASQSGFVVNEVSLANAKQYLDEDTLKKISHSIGNARIQIYPQSQSDLYRLALVLKYGGIYMDASWVALQNFDWIVNIGRYPSEFIFNRFGHLPKVFMMWHPHYGSPLEWTINAKHNTKAQWHLAYENNFIAAEKDNELIREWFQLLLGFYLKPYSEIDPILRECLIYQHKWTSFGTQYLMPMDSIKCVIGRRQDKLVKEGNKEFVSASDYYKIWSMSGYLGQQKLRSNTNFDRPGSDDNNLVYHYSLEFVEGLIGKLRHVTKYYGYHNRELSQFQGRHMNGDFSNDAHPDSLFMRHMWRKEFSLQWGNNQPRLKKS